MQVMGDISIRHSHEKKSAGKTDSRVKDMPERSAAGNTKIDAKILEHKNMFDFGKMPEDAVKVLENFDEIVQSVRPLNSRHDALNRKLFHIRIHDLPTANCILHLPGKFLPCKW